ncbi:MAG: T9SS type A sorting domain-containing protein [Ignavibacteriaceae bacterium]|nr:T9SS type A sorting domain-containing protein [Ignavibacteriaceae bacterium]
MLTTTTSTQYEDLTETYPNQVGMNHTVEYRITANDNQPLESVPSDIVQALVQGAYLDKAGNQNQTGNSITEYRLYSSYPNPFNPVTIIEFALPEQSDITLKVYDILGTEIVTLAAGNFEPGRYTVPFDGTSHASGVYIYKLSYGKGQSITRKMTLLK